MNSFYVTTPIYYVNAKPHLGHAYTTILADTVNRFHLLLQERTYFLTGTDEHGDKIVQAAADNNQDPQSYVDAISAQFQELWPQLGIATDQFIRTTQERHKQTVQRFLQLVYDNGDIYFGEYGGYYCFGCERFYTEKELADGLCPDHLKKPEYIQEANYFFRMSSYQDWLREYIQDNPDFIQPSQYRNEVLAMLREPMDDLCISRPKSRLTWGIELPFDSRYVTYVWFDALINYISALDWPSGEKFAAFWPFAHHVVAKDILKPHAIFWPTMLKAAGLQPYKGLRVHGYWKVDEAKMSKSLGNVVEPLSMRTKYGLDGFRYFLMREMHFGHDGSFTEPALVNRFNADLANDLGNLFNRSLAMTHKYFQGAVPECGPLCPEDREVLDLGHKAVEAYIDHFQSFQVAQALEAFWEFVRGMNRYIDAMAPWGLNKEGNSERLQTVMAVVLASLRRIALAVWPVMPDAGEKLLQQLGQDPDPKQADLRAEGRDWTMLAPGTRVAKTSNLFPRQELDMDRSKGDEDWAGKQAASRKAARKAKDVREAKEPAEIEFPDFQKLDLRVGTVVQAEPVPKADKLLKLQVDIGEDEPRQIVAGLAQDFSPAEVQGRQVVVVANLKARKMRGVTSQGMVLAVHDVQGLRLLGPEEAVQAGSRVS
ncbi:methionine--tRNA ligase [Desulfovermiculus halophilus]|uniref:methionine--tRNA ligase n=1 Tax=Desulfovermiculus halophilus TaxID=339722 RepID=UPI000480BB67|nr:methionine--tRNA ligase [Desulfovermiculus halophilus]